MNKNIKVFTISAKAQGGKDTTAEFMKEIYETQYNKKVCVLHFAWYLKSIAKEYLGWDGDKNNPNGRTLLQQFGTDIVREKLQMEDFWVDSVIDQIKILSEYYDVFLLPDARFPSEIDKMYDKFGVENVCSIHVTRIDEDLKPFKSHLTEEQLNHPSETALNNYLFNERLLNFSNDFSVLKLGVTDLIKSYEKVMN